MSTTNHYFINYSPAALPEAWFELVGAFLAEMEAAGYNADEFNYSGELDEKWAKSKETTDYLEGFITDEADVADEDKLKAAIKDIMKKLGYTVEALTLD